MSELVQITIDGEPALAVLDGLGARLLDATPAMRSIQITMLESTTENFAAQGRPDAWVDLQPATIARRRNKDKDSIQILRDTGALEQSLSMGDGNEYSLRELTPQSTSIGTNRPGAIAHQNGYAEGNIPQRRFLQHQEQDRANYVTILHDYFVSGFGTGGDAAIQQEVV